MTPQSIVHWFGPPDFARVDLRDRARSLWIVSWPFFVVVAVLLGVAVIVEPDTLVRRATTVAAVGGLMTLLHATSRAGRPVLASWILVIGLPVIVTQRAWLTGGIHAPVSVFYVAFIVIAGALLGARGAVATAIACTLGAIALTVATALGQITVREGAGSAFGAFAFVLLAIGIALLLHALVTFRPRPPDALDADAVHLLVGDMRSPMQSLVSHLELIRPKLRGESLKDADAALIGVKTLRRMTNRLLDVSRLQAGRMQVHRAITDLSGLANSVVGAIRDAQPTRDIAVETDGDSTCHCDPNLTRRTIEILVNSAMEVTTIDGPVRVILTGSPGRVSIAVTDEGPKVPWNYRTRIFEPYRTDRIPRAAAEESSGLGLAFCKLAIEAQGGTIHVEDGRPRGNVFIAELPRH
jgi:signal transduction histidine kinase